ncbi:hypothetical protein MBLNU459_g7344t1 [Dothideomycetes sp. NU459]
MRNRNRTTARPTDVVGKLNRGELLLYESNGLPFPPAVSCADRIEVVLALDAAARTDEGVEVAISNPLVLAVASIGAIVMVSTTTDDDAELVDVVLDATALEVVLARSVELVATMTLGEGVLDVSTIKLLVLTAVELITKVLDPMVGVTLCCEDDAAALAEPAAEPTLFAFGHKLLVPVPARKATMTFSPVTPLFAQEVLTDWVKALRAEMQDVEHLELVKSEGWQPLIVDV